jgi:MraZ protein
VINLYEVHESTVDAKGRVLLPGVFKKQLGKAAAQGFVIKRSIFSRSLDLYPMATWKSLAAEVQKLNRFVKKNVEFIRLFNAGVKSASLDKAGRFLIPPDLLDHAGIKKDIVLSSATDRIEIWDKKSYEKFLKENGGRFEHLTEDVMGNPTGGPNDR